MSDTDISISAAVSVSPCSMREACARALLDRGGERCPSCPLRDLCKSEARWLVRAAPLN